MELNYEQIENYIQGELSAEEQNAFETKMHNDAAYKKEVELYISIHKSLANKYRNLKQEKALSSTLEIMGEKHFKNHKVENTNTTRKFKLNYVRIVSLAAVLIIGFFLLKPQQNLYTEFAEHHNLEVQVKGDNAAILIEASELFNTKNYKAATPLLENYLKENSDDQEVQMALGISLLETNKLEKAKIIFSQIYASETVFKNKAALYMALSNLKANDIEQTRAFLQEIDENSFYSKKAKELLKKLKSRK